jgi:hypothetical protein
MMPIMVIYLSSFWVGRGHIWELLFDIKKFFDYGGKFDCDCSLIISRVYTIIISFLILSFFCSCIAEVARKIRSKDKEEKGVNTYTAVFGIPKAILLLSVLEICTFTCQFVIIGKEYYLPLILVLAFCLISNMLFINKPTHKMSKLIEATGNIYIAFSYLSMFLLFNGISF